MLGLALVGWCVVRPAFGEARDRAAYSLRTWQIEDGLPENSATAIAQSREGYLWFGTFDGLVRFDGVRCDVFNQENTPALPASAIVHLYLDQRERLWVSTANGLVVREGDAWRRCGPADGFGEPARSFAEGANGDLLMTTFDGSIHLIQNDRFLSLPLPREKQRGPTAASDASGRWWLVQQGFAGVWENEKWLTLPGITQDETATAICCSARSGGVWIVTRQAVLHYRSPSEYERIPLASDMRGLWSAYEDSRGHLWVCTHDFGVFRISRDGSQTHWTTATGLPYNGVRCAFEDREGNIWIGTSGGGLVRLTERRCQTFGVESGISEPIVNAVSADGQGGVFVGTYGRGLFHLKDGAATPVRLGPGGGYIQSVLVDRARRTWVGTYGDGLFVIEPTGTRRVAPDLSGGANVLALFEDSKSRLWMSGGEGVASFDGTTTRTYGESDGLPNAGVCAFAEDKDGSIWVTNRLGIFRLTDDRFREVRDHEGHPIRDIVALHVAHDGAVWMGSRRDGLHRWYDGRLQRLADATGVLGSSILSIVDDDDGYWWMSTTRGLLRVAANQLTAIAEGTTPQIDAQRLRVVDGMATIECSGGRQPVATRDERGRLWFATRKGVTMVDPTTFRRNDRPPPVVIESVGYVTPQRQHERAISRSDELAERTRSVPPASGVLHLPPGSRGIEIQYTALSFTDPEEVRFQVMMDRIDTEWRDVEHRRVTAYGTLDPGAYTFRVRAANSDAVWNLEGARLTIIVEPLLWQTGWFRGSAVILLAGLSGGSAWWIAQRRQRVRRRAEDRFRLALEASPSAMMLIDGDGRIVFVNAQAERSFGYSRSEMIGQCISSLIPERYASTHAAIREACHSRGAVDIQAMAEQIAPEITGTGRDGREIPIELGVNLIDTESGRFVLASMNDISARKRAELDLMRQRNEVAHLSRVNMLGELSGSIAHELNQPLTAILSNAQAAQRFLQREPIDLGEVREILDDIVEQDKRAGEVIRRLRTLLKKGDIQYESLAIDEVIHEVLKLARSDFMNHSVSVTAEVPPGLPLVRGDRIQLQQVLLNLVMNACDGMDRVPAPRRQLVVSAELHRRRQVQVTVRDTGTGIPDEHIERLFEPFFTTKAKGMGLGLAICRTIVASHAGEIWVTSNPEGGASFHFTLPTVETDESDTLSINPVVQ